jgi:lipooligosaccharide transport system permease protein
VTAIALGRGALLFERNWMVYRRTWMIIFSGLFEPLFYLASMGIGLGHYVPHVDVEGVGLISYSSFIAPALLAAAAMNGAVYDSTNVFWKMKYAKVYDAMLATPIGPTDVAVGETAWALFRGLLYAAAFLVVAAALGLIHSMWAVLALPAALLIGFGFAGVGIAGTTYMRNWQDFEFLAIVQLPMFLFSATFYPLSVYPETLQWVIRCTPLYNAIALMRGLMLGSVGWYQLANIAYLVVMGLIGVRIAGRRVHKLLLT